MPRDNITLQCTDCKSRNYATTKNKKTTTERLEFKKFCRRCRKHTGHKETKLHFRLPIADLLLAFLPRAIRNRKLKIGNVRRGIVSTVSTSVSKTESPGSNPGTPAKIV